MQSRRIIPCLMAILVDAMGFGLVYPVITAMFTTTHDSILSPYASIALRHFYLGLGYMLYPLTMFFGASFMGDLSDKYGRKITLIICMTGICLSFLMMGFGVTISSITLLMIGRAFSGLMAGSQPVAQASIADFSTPDNKALNMSIATMALTGGIVLGPIIGGVFSEFSFSLPFYIAAALALIAGLWVKGGFKETFTINKEKKIRFWRPIQIFYEAFHHKSIRMLSIIYLLMQVGFSLYFQLILVHLKYRFNYRPLLLGLFNAWIGIGFALALIIVIRLVVKVWRIEVIACGALLATGICQVISALVGPQYLVWILAIPVATADMLAFTAMLTSFSNAADKSMQGWVMGISGAVMALSWALTGFSTNLISTLGTDNLILIGGVLIIVGGILMWFYNKSHFQENSHKPV